MPINNNRGVNSQRRHHTEAELKKQKKKVKGNKPCRRQNKEQQRPNKLRISRVVLQLRPKKIE